MTSPAKPIELDYVQTTFSQLNTADKRMFPLQSFGQLPLRQAGCFTHGHQFGLEYVVMRGKSRFLHALIMRKKVLDRKMRAMYECECTKRKKCFSIGLYQPGLHGTLTQLEGRDGKPRLHSVLSLITDYK